ncbi:hypothetical protein FOG48_03657 [Hanseniaspora uvarum]|nr:hypothetical protein FOG48_03657 [Hanseniaspora uvarum]
MSNNIPTEINNILSDSNAYELIESKVYNKLLTDTKVIQNLKQNIIDILLKDESLSINKLVNELNIQDVDSLLNFDKEGDKSVTKQKVRDVIIKELENILY